MVGMDFVFLDCFFVLVFVFVVSGAASAMDLGGTYVMARYDSDDAGLVDPTLCRVGAVFVRSFRGCSFQIRLDDLVVVVVVVDDGTGTGSDVDAAVNVGENTNAEVLVG